MAEYTCNMPVPNGPMVDPDTGQPGLAWYRWALAVFRRTGDGVGIATSDVQAQAVAAQVTANAAQTAAAAAEADAIAAQATATAAQAAVTAEAAARTTAIAAEATTRAAADTTETAARIAADALRAPIATPTFTTSIRIDIGGPTWTQGAAAPSSTQPVGSLYSRAGGAVGATLYVSRGAGAWLAVAGV